MDSTVTSILDARNLTAAAEIRRDLDRAGIPAHLHGGLVRYVVHRIPPGHFLTALLSNDLLGTVNLADDPNIALIQQWLRVLYSCEEIPAKCWGSRDRVDRWTNWEPRN